MSSVDRQRPREEEDDDDDEQDDDEDDDEYDFDGGSGDAVDDAAGGLPRVSDDEGVLSRAKRACWPPPPAQQPSLPRGPVWTPLLRVHVGASSPDPPRAPPPRHASQAGPSGPPRGPGTSPGPRHPAAGPRQPRPFVAGNPVYGSRMKLFSRTGFHLSIGPKGRVTGTANPNDKYAVLEFSSVTPGEVRIRGVEANLFLAMNREGKLYGQANVRQEGTVFVEMMLGQYNTYLSRKFAHVGWYVGIKKNGKQKSGLKTAWGQKAIQFLPIRV